MRAIIVIKNLVRCYLFHEDKKIEAHKGLISESKTTQKI